MPSRRVTTGCGTKQSSSGSLELDQASWFKASESDLCFRSKREREESELAEKEEKAARMRQAREEEKQRRKDAHNHTKLLKDKLRGLQQQRVGLRPGYLDKSLTLLPSTS